MQCLAGKSQEEISQFVSNAHRAVNLALASARDAGWPLIEIDNGGGDPALAAGQLQHMLAHYRLPAGADRARQAGQNVADNTAGNLI